MARRYAESVIHFYEVFMSRVSRRYLKALSATLLSCVASLAHSKRLGELSIESADRLVNQVIDACAIPRHQSVLRAYVTISNLTPARVPGLRWITRQSLRL